MTTTTESDTPLPLMAAIYTDGGCRPSKANGSMAKGENIGGWGIHGYFFTNTPANTGSGCKGHMPTEKGYLKGESGKTNISLTKYVDGFGTLPAPSTNNIAELSAATKAMSVAIQEGVRDLRLIMDSQYVQGGLEEWSIKWEANNWNKHDGTPVANADLWKQAIQLKRALENDGCNVTCQWVKGHNAELGNELADQNATRAVIAGRNHWVSNEIKLSDAKGYWNVKANRNRLFSHPNWFFSGQSEVSKLSGDGRYIYYLGDPREKDEFLGKKIANATFSVLYIKEPDEAMETIRTAVESMGKNRYQGLTVARLDKIFLPKNYKDILEYQGKLLVKDFARQRIMTTMDDLLAEELRPARMAYSAIDALQALEAILIDYLNPKTTTRVRVTDITDLLYESESGKKKTTYKLKSEITVSKRSLTVKASHAVTDRGDGVANLVLTLGQDLPDRNTLSAIAGESTKVKVLTWPESKEALCFATVVETEGDVGIWSGIYSNLHMLASDP